MARRAARQIKLSSEELEALERLVRRRKISRGEAQRAEIVLRAAREENNCRIAEAVGVTRKTVQTWRERFAKHRLDGLSDEPRCGAPRKIGDDRIEAVKGYDSDAFVETLESRGITPVIPPKANRKQPRPTDFALYRERNLVERFFCKLKQYRAIATRYDKLANTFLAAVARICARCSNCLVTQISRRQRFTHTCFRNV